MTRKDKGKFADKYPKDRKTNPAVVEAINAKAEHQTIPCATAFVIAADLNAPSEEVGFTIDKLGIRITKCQLGLFGNTPISKIVQASENVSAELENAIREALVDNLLPCVKAWEIAAQFKIPRIRVSGACEALKLKISSCQLNAF